MNKRKWAYVEECEILMDNSDVPVEGEIGESNDKGEMGESNDDENDESQNIDENDDRVGTMCAESNQSLHQKNETETVCEGFENDVDNEELLVSALTMHQISPLQYL